MGPLAIQAARTARPARSHAQSGGRGACLGRSPQQASRDPVLPGSHARTGQGTAARAGASRQAGQTPAGPGKSSACRTCTAAPRSMSPASTPPASRLESSPTARGTPAAGTRQNHTANSRDAAAHGAARGPSSPMARQRPRSFRDHQTGFRTQCRRNGHRFSEGRRTDADRLASPGLLGTGRSAPDAPLMAERAALSPIWELAAPPLLLTQCD